MCHFTCQTCKATINQRETATHVCAPRADETVTGTEVHAALMAYYGESGIPDDEPYSDEEQADMRRAITAAREARP